MTPDAEQIMAALIAEFRAQPWVLALWEGGSAASGRKDEYSDLDVSIAVQDEYVEHAFVCIERALESIGTIDRSIRVPEPTWHGHSQCFHHLEGTPATLLIDCAVMKQSARDHFLAPEQHGHAVVHFDRACIVKPPDFDADALRASLHHAYARLVTRFEMFEDVLVPKEIARGRALDAMQFYYGFTLKPLLHMIGIAHRPLRHDFGRYARAELPPDVYARLEPLYFITDLDDLAHKHALGKAFFWEVARAVDIDALDLDGDSRRSRSRAGVSTCETLPQTEIKEPG